MEVIHIAASSPQQIQQLRFGLCVDEVVLRGGSRVRGVGRIRLLLWEPVGLRISRCAPCHVGAVFGFLDGFFFDRDALE
jgi:hypothetical protein